MRFSKRHQHLLQDIMVGLTVSAVSLSLGGAFGLLSGRGVIAGMLSAALYPLITSAFGGTRIQCSGPTGPMTTVFIALMASATESLQGVQAELIPAFLNMTLFLTAVILLISGLLRLGNWIRIVPNIVISGFMDGIALIIWVSQCKKLLQIGSPIIEGPIMLNIAIALITLITALLISRMTRMLPGTLIALVLMTVLCSLLNLPIDRAVPDIALHSWSELQSFAATHSPTRWPWHLMVSALPWAVQLAGIAYLDTLLTSLIIDKKQRSTSKRNRELGAQGIATTFVALVGGIPGAQATERSVLMLKEGAQTRLAGILVGVFGLIGVFLLQDVVSLVPKAVFAGILLKVGYDVFDWTPLVLYIKQSKKIAHQEICIIAVTAVVTTIVNVIAAVIVGIILCMVLQVSDIKTEKETEGFIDEP